MMRFLFALLPLLILCGCTTVYEEPEIRRKTAVSLTPEESSYRASAWSSAVPAPLRKTKPPIVWNEELYSKVQAVSPELFLRYSNDIRRIQDDKEARIRFLQIQFSEFSRRYPVELTGRTIQAGMMLKNILPAESAMTLAGSEEDFIRTRDFSKITAYNRLKTQRIRQELALRELKALFGNPENDRDLCQYPVYAVQKLEYLGFCNLLAYTVRQIQAEYRREKR